jgi:uroporphyrinogen decarboxylase
MKSPFSVDVTPDWRGFVDTILRRGTPKRAHYIELFLDREVQEAILQRYGVLDGLRPDDPYYEAKRELAAQSFLGYDFVHCGPESVILTFKSTTTQDSATELTRAGGRGFMEEHKGPITTWEEFEKYPWPSPGEFTSRNLEWFEKHLPDNMCVVGMGVAHYAEFLCWLMGYETFCVALCEKRDLVDAITQKVTELSDAAARLLVQFDKVKVLWGSDDMGFRGGLLVSPDDMREYVLPGHKGTAKIAHDAGRAYILHSCGNLSDIMDDLIDDVRIDGKHSYEDTIEDVRELKSTYGKDIALLGGIDLDFLCRASESEVRTRVRDTLEKCQPGGGYCVGTGNSVANYIPVDNYLAMLDEGRKFKA